MIVHESAKELFNSLRKGRSIPSSLSSNNEMPLKRHFHIEVENNFLCPENLRPASNEIFLFSLRFSFIVKFSCFFFEKKYRKEKFFLLLAASKKSREKICQNLKKKLP